MNQLNQVISKIENAYTEYKTEMTALKSKELYERAYKVFSIEEIYFILINGYEYSDKMIQNILNFKGNILEQIYQEWIDCDYTHQDAFEEIIRSAVCSLS